MRNEWVAVFDGSMGFELVYLFKNEYSGSLRPFFLFPRLMFVSPGWYLW